MVFERDVEKRLVDGVRKLGGLCFKWTSPGRSGVPDRLVIINGYTFMVELKRKNGVLGASQRIVFPMLNRHGCNVYVLYDAESVDAFLQQLKDGIGHLSKSPDGQIVQVKDGEVHYGI